MFLQDKEFLTRLFNQPERKTYVRITALTFKEENPIDTIEGVVTQGSINIDEKSLTRRSCSLTLVTNLFNSNQEDIWVFKTKFKLEVGIYNNINDRYPSICWFNQGIYVITSFNTSVASNNYTISIQAKDKMCLLDGSVGGALTATVDFGQMEIAMGDGGLSLTSIPIITIIKNILYQYGEEVPKNVIIKDLDMKGLELLEYRGDSALYLVRPNEEYSQTKSLNYQNITFNRKVKTHQTGSEVELDSLEQSYFDTILINGLNTPGQKLWVGDKSYQMAKVQTGDLAGYKVVDLVYAGELVGKAGDSVSSVLKKISDMLQEFEFFYDINGKFIFQKKPIFINQYWATKTYKNCLLDFSEQENHQTISMNLINNLNITPTINNIKNDYSIWGERTSVNGAKIPIHYRYAFDKPPIEYNSIDTSDDNAIKALQEYNSKYNTVLQPQTPNKYSTKSNSITNFTIPLYDVQYYNSEYKDKAKPIITNPDNSVIFSSGIRFNSPLIYQSKSFTFTLKALDKIPSDKPLNLTIYIKGHEANSSLFYASTTLNFTQQNETLQCVLNQNSTTSFLNTKSFEFDIYLSPTEYYKDYDFPQIQLISVVANDTINPMSNLDWREIIYQMAKDYYHYGWMSDFQSRVAKANPTLYPQGSTNYEQYYTDIYGFWRDLYNPSIFVNMSINQEKQNNIYQQLQQLQGQSQEEDIDVFNPISSTLQETELSLKAVEAAIQAEEEIIIKNSEQFLLNSTEITIPDLITQQQNINLLKEIENNLKEKQIEYQNVIHALKTQLDNLKMDYEQLKENLTIYNYFETSSSVKRYWHRNRFYNPELLNFWFEFASGLPLEFEELTVEKIGIHPIVVNDNNIKAIAYRETPSVIFSENLYNSKEEQETELESYGYIHIPNLDELFVLSTQGKSAEEKMQELLNTNGYIGETISITCAPIYYLSPNEFLYIPENDYNISGKYMINKLTIPLDYKGNMSISATKFVPWLF